MRHHRWFAALVLASLVAWHGAPAPADGGPTPDWTLRGGFQLGVRSVDVEGRQEKYREDLDLETGPRLFLFDLDLVPPADMRQYLDHVEVSLNRIGGDPFESLRFKIDKYGRYSLKWEQRKSAYFYEDLVLPPELASPELANVGDLHTFDFDRVRDSASLSLWLGDSGRFDFGFDRFTKKGRSTTTYDIQRDDFEVDRPIDESLSDYHAGFSYDWERVTVSLREHVRKYDNSVEAFLPGASPGSMPDDPTVLDFFFLTEPYDLSSYSHLASVVVHPSEKLLLQIEAGRETLDLDLSTSESSSGTDFLGRPFTTDSIGSGALSRDLGMLDVGLSYRWSDRVALVLEVVNRTLDQDGELDIDGERIVTSYRLDTTRSEAALQVEPTGEITLSAGIRNESREVETEVDDPQQETEHSGYFASIGWRPEPHLSLSARLEESSFDNPFSVASPSDRRNLRLRARYSRPLGASVSAAYHLDSLDNSKTGWQAEIERLALRAGYRFALLSLSVGYSVINTDREIDQAVLTLPGFLGGLELLFPIDYRADTEIVDARFSWAVNPRFKLGGDVRMYENAGSFPLERDQSRLYSEIGFGRGYVAHLGLRRVDYDEGLDNFDDYRADIVELSLGYRWR